MSQNQDNSSKATSILQQSHLTVCQELSEVEQELIKGGVVNTPGRIKVQFLWDRGSITKESSPGSASINEIRLNDKPGIEEW